MSSGPTVSGHCHTNPGATVTHHALHGDARRDVRAEDCGAPTALSDVLGHRFRLFEALAIVHGDRSSGRCECQRDRPTDTARAAGNQGHLVL